MPAYVQSGNESVRKSYRGCVRLFPTGALSRVAGVRNSLQRTGLQSCRRMQQPAAHCFSRFARLMPYTKAAALREITEMIDEH